MVYNKWAAVGAAGFMAGTALGAGFQLYTEGSTEALGQAGAISGRDDLTSLAWYNPSALAGTQSAEIMLGATFVSIRTDFESDIDSSFDSSMDDAWRTVPHLYYVQPISEKWTGMVSVNAPYGLITEWPEDWVGNQAAILSDLETIYTTPSIAYRINDGISVALGMNVVYADVELTADRDLTAVSGPDLGIRTVEGDDFGYGYTFSAHWDVVDDWALGGRYQSRVKLNFDGDAGFSNIPGESSAGGELTLPSTINFGVANSSLEKLKVGLDLLWTEWSTYDELVFNFGAGYPAPPLDNPDVVPKRWDDVWSIRLGGEYALSDRWTLRAGYVWDQSPVNDETRSPEMPGDDRQMVMTGIGWKKGNFGVDLAYSFLWVKEAVTGSEVNAATGGATAGTYDAKTHLVALSGSYMF